jgi:hypothetical protein
MIRYANDFIITGISQEMLENEVKPLVEAFLSVRGLKLSHEKTTITHIDEGFDFLGWNARKYGGKLLIKPSRKSVRAFLRELRKLVKEGKALKQHKADRETQSAYPRLGELSPLLGRRPDLQFDEPCDLADAVAMGEAPPPKQIQTLDPCSVLHRIGEPAVGVRGGREGCQRNIDLETLGGNQRHSHQATRQNPGESESLRPEMGRVFRSA